LPSICQTRDGLEAIPKKPSEGFLYSCMCSSEQINTLQKSMIKWFDTISFSMIEENLTDTCAQSSKIKSSLNQKIGKNLLQKDDCHVWFSFIDVETSFTYVLDIYQVDLERKNTIFNNLLEKSTQGIGNLKTKALIYYALIPNDEFLIVVYTNGSGATKLKKIMDGVFKKQF
jgi:hypothetical protein